MPGVLAAWQWNLGLVAWNRAALSGSDVSDEVVLRRAVRRWEQALTWGPARSDFLLYLGSAYEQVGDERGALRTWQQLDRPFQALMTEGRSYLTGGFASASLPWFRGASKVAPDVGDPWYYIAQALVQVGRPEGALEALDKALQAPRLEELHRSQLYFEKGVIYQWRLQPSRLQEAAEAYRAALTWGGFPTADLEADAHYKLGETLWWKGDDPALYIVEFQRAIVLNPDHSHAHVLLGVAYYLKTGDVEKAEREIMLGMKINPQNVWGPMNLGAQVYEPAGMIEEAVEAYRWALNIQPDFEPAARALQRLQTGRSSP